MSIRKFIGYKTIIVMNDNQTQEKDLLRNIGADLRLVTQTV